MILQLTSCNLLLRSDQAREWYVTQPKNIPPDYLTQDSYDHLLGDMSDLALHEKALTIPEEPKPRSISDRYPRNFKTSFTAEGEPAIFITTTEFTGLTGLEEDSTGLKRSKDNSNEKKNTESTTSSPPSLWQFLKVIFEHVW